MAAALVAACSFSVSQGVDAAGRAQHLVFPETGQASAIKGGVFVNVDNLRPIGPGVSKDDLYQLLGRPHFNEAHGAREWDYVFKFRSGANAPVTVCQYKVIFDQHMRGQTFAWKPQACARFLGQAQSADAAPPRLSLQADALFGFGRWQGSDLLPAGRSALDAFARSLLAREGPVRVQVVGHTDRLGPAAYNQRLSEGRAATVRQYLVEQGLPAASLQSSGKGASEPVVHCPPGARATLIDCLAPNRRVDVHAWGLGP